MSRGDFVRFRVNRALTEALSEQASFRYNTSMWERDWGR